MAKLIFGCGYLGERVARRWRDGGHDVFVVTRSKEKAQRFTATGYQPLVADLMQPASLANLPAAETVLYAVGFDRAAGLSRHALYVDGLHGILAALPPDTGKFIYISSTGVYGQSDGERVDEQSPCHPAREGGRACLDAERVLAGHPLGASAIVLRMAGLYGPGRVPNAAAIRRGETIAAPEVGYLNLIHVDDAAQIVLAAEQRATPPRMYVVADGNPVERREYYDQLARLLAADPPRFAALPVDAPAARRAASSKRINNARLMAELGVSLAYPSFREGLAAIMAAENTPGG